ncbi:uncharacterized protein BO66DRAFT_438419 [Aspergillus aculeatinus CBS 121060]|uniref:Uncharacterized protein n=1 Tax=Aspergillus aculeatinus CBS 121060 TaxID=1448322 RepID=A0ACD1HAJ0_9EURO|nr:hypothetical protein BO66DRAFT_438419 [Aspergillus aculeatinus CBS 121060]RAH70419.1 hypothetical protein BO66DRAFT_438419 [Aspergillus aculeatinus CBS 121060]
MSSQPGFHINRLHRSRDSKPDFDQTEWGVADCRGGKYHADCRIILLVLNPRTVGDNWKLIGERLASLAIKRKRQKCKADKCYTGPYGVVVECEDQDSQFYIETSDSAEADAPTLTRWICDDPPTKPSPLPEFYYPFIRRMYSDNQGNPPEHELVRRAGMQIFDIYCFELTHKPFLGFEVFYKDHCGVESLIGESGTP